MHMCLSVSVCVCVWGGGGTGIWVYTCFMHRFVDGRRKDYYVMCACETRVCPAVFECVLAGEPAIFAVFIGDLMALTTLDEMTVCCMRWPASVEVRSVHALLSSRSTRTRLPLM